MNNFYEAVLQMAIKESNKAKVYKKAIENEQDRYWTQNVIKENGVVTNHPIPVWLGNVVYVTIEKDVLEVTMVSRTLPNLKESVAMYERDGMKLIKKNYE